MECLLDIEIGGMSMVILDSYNDSRIIKFLYRIINKPIGSWNAMENIGWVDVIWNFNEPFVW